MVRIKTFKYNDGLAQRRKNVQRSKVVILGAIILSAFGFLGYVLFFSNRFEVQNIDIQGLNRIDKNQVKGKIFEFSNKKKFKLLTLNKNIFLIDEGALRAEILSSYQSIKDLEIKTDYPHGLKLSFVEREPLGIWCFKDDCKYFDDQGFRWAVDDASELVRIYDDRQDKVDGRFFEIVKAILDSMNKIDLDFKSISISNEPPYDIKVRLDKGYDLIFGLDSKISEQVEVLRIFIEEKGENQGF